MNKILIASDRASVRARLRTLCTNNGFHICEEATSPARALLSSELNIPDIVIFNFRSPLKILLPVVAQIASLGKRVKVIVYSAALSRCAAQAYLRAGAVGLIAPKSTTEELTTILQAIRAGFTVVPIIAFKARVKVAHRPEAFPLPEPAGPPLPQPTHVIESCSAPAVIPEPQPAAANPAIDPF